MLAIWFDPPARGSKISHTWGKYMCNMSCTPHSNLQKDTSINDSCVVATQVAACDGSLAINCDSEVPWPQLSPLRLSPLRRVAGDQLWQRGTVTTVVATQVAAVATGRWRSTVTARYRDHSCRHSGCRRAAGDQLWQRGTVTTVHSTEHSCNDSVFTIVFGASRRPAYTWWPELLLLTLGELLQATWNANDRRHIPATNFTTMYHLLRLQSWNSFMETVTPLDSLANYTRLQMWRCGYIDSTQSVNYNCGKLQTMAHLLCCWVLDEPCSGQWRPHQLSESEQRHTCAQKSDNALVWRTGKKENHLDGRRQKQLVTVITVSH